MWYFFSPKIYFGDDAVQWLSGIKGHRAFIVTDENMVRLGFFDIVAEQLRSAGLEIGAFTEIEPEAHQKTVVRCAQVMSQFAPDWVVGLGGGSCIDASKVAWLLYERPDISLDAINPLETYGLRQKARLIAIPTTAGSGSDVSQAAILLDPEERRKVAVVCYEFMADYSLVDPRFTLNAPPELTADTGMDVLCHAIDTYNATLTNDFIDGLCLHSARLVFENLPTAVRQGSASPEAREKMANAATIAGMAVANSNIALVHALGHGAGAVLRLPHGRVTAIFLPLVIEYNTNGGVGKYLDIVRYLGLEASDESAAGKVLSHSVRKLMQQINLPLSLRQAGIPIDLFQSEQEAICDLVEMDLGLVSSRRFPYREDIRRLLEYAYEGITVDF